MRGSNIKGGFFLLLLGLQHAAGCPIEVPTATLTVDDVSLECTGIGTFIRSVKVTIPARFVTGNGSASTINFTLRSIFGDDQQGTLTVGDDIVVDATVIAGPYSLLFDDDLCPGVALTFDVDDGTCPFDDCPPFLSFDSSSIVTPSEGVCLEAGATVLIPGGSVDGSFASDVTYQYTIAQGTNSADGPAALILADDISVDLVPNVEATITVVVQQSLGQCAAVFTFTPACDPQCGTDFVCDGSLIDKDDKENQVCATFTCSEDDCCDARSCSDYACSTGEEVPVVLQETLCSTTAGDANECSDGLCCVNCFTEVTCNPKSAKPINSGAPCSGGQCNRGQCCVGE